MLIKVEQLLSLLLSYIVKLMCAYNNLTGTTTKVSEICNIRSFCNFAHIVLSVSSWPCDERAIDIQNVTARQYTS